MSSYKVLNEVSKRLKEIVWAAFESDPTISQIVGDPEAITFKNPTDTVRRETYRLSIWLYQVTEDEFLKNCSALRSKNGGNQHASASRSNPLALNLFYLITPVARTDNPEDAHLMLGRTLQTLHDNATFLLQSRPDAQDRSEDVVEDLRIEFLRLTLEELTRIWEALEEPYRLSVSYKVRVVRIDAAEMPKQARVIDRAADFGDDAAIDES